MAKKKDSNLKKVGRFVANEMLGVDDAKRAVNKARKGDFKGALKSAATAAFEAGTTVTGGTYLGGIAGDNPSSQAIGLEPYDLYIAPGQTLTISGFSSIASQIEIALNWSEDI